MGQAYGNGDVGIDVAAYLSHRGPSPQSETKAFEADLIRSVTLQMPNWPTRLGRVLTVLAAQELTSKWTWSVDEAAPSSSADQSQTPSSLSELVAEWLSRHVDGNSAVVTFKGSLLRLRPPVESPTTTDLDAGWEVFCKGMVTAPKQFGYTSSQGKRFVEVMDTAKLHVARVGYPTVQADHSGIMHLAWMTKSFSLLFEVERNGDCSWFFRNLMTNEIDGEDEAGPLNARLADRWRQAASLPG